MSQLYIDIRNKRLYARAAYNLFILRHHYIKYLLLLCYVRLLKVLHSRMKIVLHLNFLRAQSFAEVYFLL